MGETETGEVSYHKRKLELSYDTIHTIRYSLYDRGFALKRELKDCESLGTFTSLQGSEQAMFLVARRIKY